MGSAVRSWFDHATIGSDMCGMMVLTDLRLSGWAMQRRTVSAFFEQLLLWSRAGYAPMTLSDLLLAWAEPLKLYRSPSFWVKMGLLAAVGLHAFAFRNRMYENAKALDAGLARQGKLAAALSFIR